jgi:hypothetical protein
MIRESKYLFSDALCVFRVLRVELFSGVRKRLNTKDTENAEEESWIKVS